MYIQIGVVNKQLRILTLFPARVYVASMCEKCHRRVNITQNEHDIADMFAEIRHRLHAQRATETTTVKSIILSFENMPHY